MLELFHTPITVLHVVVCFMVMLVVLIQPGKSGGLGAALGGAGAQQIFGGRGAGNFLTRTTWIAASVFFITSITLAYISTSTGDSLQKVGDAARKRDSSESAPAEPAPTDTAPAGAAAPSEPAPPADSPAAPGGAGEPVPSDSKPQ
jgi:preprotein translocase subunit SecG